MSGKMLMMGTVEAAATAVMAWNIQVADMAHHASTFQCSQCVL